METKLKIEKQDLNASPITEEHSLFFGKVFRGKSAYQYAVDSGLFSGTEEEFAEYLGNIQNVTEDSNEATEAAIHAKENAERATADTIVAKEAAESATKNANEATTAAQNASAIARSAAEAANDSTSNANSAASNADRAASVALNIANEAAEAIKKSIYQSVTHSELVALRNNGKLVSGAFYRITDYECTTVQADSRSANHPFDIIVQALDERTLSENAQAIQHEGDTYFANAKLESWQLKYALDNDIARFSWAREEVKEQPEKWECNWGVLENTSNKQPTTVEGRQMYLYRPAQPTSYLDGKTFYRYKGREVLNFEDASELYFVTRENPFEVGEQYSPMLVIYAPTGRVIAEIEVASDNGETSDNDDATVWNTHFEDSLDMKTYGQTIDINGEVYYTWEHWDDPAMLDDWAISNSPLVISEGTKIMYNGSTDGLYYALDSIVGEYDREVYEVTDGNHIYKYENEEDGEDALLDTISYTVAIAPREGGKGVIYRMIDEHNNDCPFDFKNMQFLHNGEWYYTFSYFGADASLGDYCANNHLTIVSDQADQFKLVTTEMPMLVFNLIHNAYNKILVGILNNDVQSPIAKGFIQGFRITSNKWLPTSGGKSGYFDEFNIYSSGGVYGNSFRGYAQNFVVGSVDKLITQFYGNAMTLAINHNYNITIDCTFFCGNTYDVLISGNKAKKIVGGYIRNCYFDDYGATDTVDVALSFVANLAIENSYIRLFNALTINYGNTTSSTNPLRFLNIDARGWDSGTSIPIITIPSEFPANANYELKVAKNSKGEVKMWCDADLIQ